MVIKRAVGSARHVHDLGAGETVDYALPFFFFFEVAPVNEKRPGKIIR